MDSCHTCLTDVESPYRGQVGHSNYGQRGRDASIYSVLFTGHYIENAVHHAICCTVKLRSYVLMRIRFLPAQRLSDRLAHIARRPGQRQQTRERRLTIFALAFPFPTIKTGLYRRSGSRTWYSFTRTESRVVMSLSLLSKLFLFVFHCASRSHTARKRSGRCEKKELQKTEVGHNQLRLATRKANLVPYFQVSYLYPHCGWSSKLTEFLQ